METRPENEMMPKKQMQVEEPHVPEIERLRFRRRQSRRNAVKALILLGVYVAGLVSGYLFFGSSEKAATPVADAPKISAMLAEVNPANGIVLPVSYGNMGPLMLSAGAIALDQFVQLYQQSGKPLTGEQLAILQKGSTARITIDSKNASFLLNFFWALGLVNQNPVLTGGQMMSGGKDQVGNFASTGGWTLGAKTPTELYASTLLIPLTEEQQARLVEVASAVYRPCCDNPTHFPDCNHGMAMLGLLELMASQNASTDQMFAAAKYVNAFWFLQQMLETAIYIKATKNADFSKADARQLVGQATFSGSGFKSVHQWLANNGLLEQGSGSGGSCAVQ